MTNAGYLTIPKQLLTDPKYAELNPDAILLYSALADRLKLSAKNGKQWRDKAGNTFVYFTRKAMCALLKRSEPYVRKMLAALKKCGLLQERRQGLTKPNVLFPILLNADVHSSEKNSDVPERNDISGNNPEPSKTYKDVLPHSLFAPPAKKKYQPKKLNAQQYTQREYTREQLMSLIEEI